jgi:putative peptidoglycan lipid II flippase
MKFFKSIVTAFGISVLTQAVGLVRQIAIASYFGATRKLDIYFMTYTIANLMVFVFAVIFDTVGIPHLVRCKEEKGKDRFKELTGSIFTFSVLFSALLTLLFTLVMPIIVNLMAAGFSPNDKKDVVEMSRYFIPWILIFLPYLALCSFYKSIRSFNLVFLGELIISAVSLIFIILLHADTRFIAIAYFTGYFAAFIILFLISFKYFKRIGYILTSEMKRFYRNFAELFGANQLTSVYLFLERFIQSFLPAGGVSILSYSSQITMNISGLLTFRDIFIVPLSSIREREKKLERVLIGLLVISAPVTIFLYFFSKDIVTLLFLRGKFDSESAALLSSALSIYSLSILPSIVGVPAFRMFQVIDKIKNTAIIYIFNILSLAFFGSIFIFYMKMGVTGFAYAFMVDSYLSLILTFMLLHKNEVILDYRRIAKFAVYAITVCSISGYLSIVLPAPFIIKGIVFAILAVLVFLPLRKKLLTVIGYSAG